MRAPTKRDHLTQQEPTLSARLTTVAIFRSISAPPLRRHHWPLEWFALYGMSHRCHAAVSLLSIGIFVRGPKLASSSAGAVTCFRTHYPPASPSVGRPPAVQRSVAVGEQLQ